MKIGKLITTALLGFMFFLFIGLDLVLFGVIPLNSVVVTIMPIIGLVLGAALVVVASRKQGSAVNTAPPAA
ncbi:MAG: hypothetical protein Q7V57_03930 [Actinomycetota bacterium]|nr:hypothetical protein [Actinomycetota bacterium]